jgi:hypothetical protein
MDGARTRYAVSVLVSESFQSNVQPRCMEHSLHLAAKHFVQTIALHFGKKCANSGADTEGDPTSDNDEDSDSEDENIDGGDSLGKAIALVKQVHFSMARLY